MEGKRCLHCGEVKPASEFYVHKGHKDGLSSRCKPCDAAAGLAYRAANPERIKAKNAQWRSENAEYAAQANKRWRKANPDRVLENHRRGAAARTPEAKARAREYSREWWVENLEENLAKGRARYWADPETSRAKGRAKYAADPTPYRERDRKRRARIAGVHVEPVSFQAIYERDRGICGICHKRVSLKLKWPDPGTASLDHIIPISKGGTHEPKNVQLAHLRCNQSRGTGRLPAQMRLLD
jgi:5-methylcytosine-specific restriction endonuclease McrA